MKLVNSNEMKDKIDKSEFVGVLLLGGTGSRLSPITRYTNKHLLPVYDKPLFYYPFSIMLLAGIKEFVFVVPDRCLIENVSRGLKETGLKIDLQFVVQENPDGIVGALLSIKRIIENRPFFLALGDNILVGHRVSEILREAMSISLNDQKAVLFTKVVKEAKNYCVVGINETGEVNRLVEKPEKQFSEIVSIGFYAYPSDTSTYLDKVELSERGEYEITSLNNLFLSEGRLDHISLNRGMFWIDAGTPENLSIASNIIRDFQSRGAQQIANLEEIEKYV